MKNSPRERKPAKDMRGWTGVFVTVVLLRTMYTLPVSSIEHWVAALVLYGATMVPAIGVVVAGIVAMNREQFPQRLRPRGGRWEV